MRKIRIASPDLTTSQKTFLDADYTSGVTLTVVNNATFAKNDIIVMGEPGEEKTECRAIASITGQTTITLATAFRFPHNKGCALYRSEYDAIEISGSSAGAWEIISDLSPIQWDQLDTIYIHAGGSDGWSYRFRFRNTAALTYSDYSTTLAATGFTRTQVGYMLREIRLISGDTEGRICSDNELIRQLSKAQEIIGAVRADWWFLRRENSSLKTTANGRKYSLATITDLNFIDTVRYRYDDGTTDNIYQLIQIPFIEWDFLVRDFDEDADDWPDSYVIQPADTTSTKGYIELDRKSETANYGTFYIRYFKVMTTLAAVSDTTDVPIPSILEDYALAYLFGVKGDEVRASIYSKRFWGPSLKDKDTKDLSGLALLENMQKNKDKAMGQPAALKTWHGRRPMVRLFQTHIIDADNYTDRYW